MKTKHPIDELMSRNLVRIMNEKNIRPTDLAKITNKGKGTISQYTHLGKIGKDVLVELCQALNVAPAEFYKGEEAPGDPILHEIYLIYNRLTPDYKKQLIELARIFQIASDNK